MKRAYVSVVAMAFAAACGERPPSSPVQPPANALSASFVGGPAGPDSANYVITPAGWYHRSCVYEIPDGAVVHRGGLVTRKDGTAYHIPPCPYPSYRVSPRPTRPGNEVVPPADTGWIEWAYYSLPVGNWFQELRAQWVVPPTPAGSYSGTQVYYTFPGIQSGEYILQPVVQYGYNGYFGGSYWTAASWHCDGNCTHSSPITIAAGDTMYGSVTANNCLNGNCYWNVNTEDLTRGTVTVQAWYDTEDYWWATGGAVEAAHTLGSGLTSCDQYPDGGVFYYAISLKDRYGNQVSPSWGHAVQSGLSPFCDFHVTSSTTTVNLWHAPPLSAVITGPDSVRPGASCTWFGGVTGGAPAYNFSWSGVLYGTQPEVTGRLYYSGWLHMDVTDGSDQTAYSDVYITVTQSARRCIM